MFVMLLQRIRFFKVFGILVMSIMVAAVTGCSNGHSPNDEGRHNVLINVTWPSGINVPAGVRAIFYPIGGGTPIVYNLPASGGKADLSIGTYRVVLFNNDTEYVILNNTDNDSTLEAYTSEQSKASGSSSFPSENVVNMPDMFYSCKVNAFTVKSDSISEMLNVAPKARVDSFVVRVYIGGKTGVAGISSATGYISNVYGSFFPGTETYPKIGSIIPSVFNDKESNYIDATVRTFGVMSASNDNAQTFRLSITLTNDSTISYDWDITKQLNTDLSKGNVMVTIPDEVDISSSSSSSPSGFSVTVTGWGDPINVNM